MSKAWKEAEKAVANLLGGVRQVRTSYSDSIEDVYHPYFAIEVKYGLQCPKWIAVKHPTSNGEYDLIPSALWSWQLINKFEIVCESRDEFLRKGIAQALAYNPDKIPYTHYRHPTGLPFYRLDTLLIVMRSVPVLHPCRRYTPS